MRNPSEDHFVAKPPIAIQVLWDEDKQIVASVQSSAGPDGKPHFKSLDMLIAVLRLAQDACEADRRKLQVIQMQAKAQEDMIANHVLQSTKRGVG